MSYVVRASKFRHVFGEPRKPEMNHVGVKPSAGTPEGYNLGGNSKFLGVSWSGGGGSLALINNAHEGRLPVSMPLLKGHKGTILDWAFSPFDDYQVATASEDTSIRLWQIPEGGVTEDINDPLAVLDSHQKRVNIVTYHKSADNILASGAHDHTIKIWDVTQTSAVSTVELPEVPTSISFNWAGNSFITTTKDKQNRIVDARTGGIVQEFQAHDGSKPAKAVWAGQKDKIAITGFSRQSERTIKLFDPRNTAEPLSTVAVDVGAGLMLPMYDEDTSVLFVAGKGDTTVRYYEIGNDDNPLFFLSSYSAKDPQKGACILPKMAGDISKCEIARMCRLTNSVVEVVSMIVPRKSSDFQDDIFGDTAAPEPALSAEEWLGGQDAEPKLISVKKLVEGGDDAPRKQVKNVFQLQKELDEKDKRIAELEAELAKLRGA